jgi:hypothetical protein
MFFSHREIAILICINRQLTIVIIAIVRAIATEKWCGICYIENARSTRENKAMSSSAIDVPDLRDPNDNIILATDLPAGADVIVTGDSLRDSYASRDLLVLQEYEGIPIVTAKEFLERYFPEN